MRDFSIIKQKILQYLDCKGISKYKFYQETGITNGILSQSNGLSEENTFKFLSTYRDISLTWLFYGEGSMLNTDEPNSIIQTSSDKPSNDLITPLLDRIEEQAKKIARLELELEHYRSTDAATANP
jgi:hypothetical protein